jgi:predicted Rossmann fold nucleotide-binding protein DprA/Smf involved in DNA uptake
LLRSGRAWPVRSAEDVLDAPSDGVFYPAPAPASAGPFAEILNAIEPGSDTPADLCERLAMPLPKVLSILAEAELEGYVKRTASNTYEVIARAC